VRASTFYRLFFGLKWTQAVNHLRLLRSHLWVHFAVALCVFAMLLGGGTLMFGIVFHFLMREEYATFGLSLMDQLIKMVLLAFFSMLIFSNLIIMLTTTYISREVEFLMGQPIPHRRLFFGKLGESMVYSSWAFVVLSLPFFTALGITRHLPAGYYLGATLMLVPYLIIPAALGAAVALLVTAFFPPRRAIGLAFVLGALGIAMALLTRRAYGLSGIWSATGTNELARLMRFVSLGDLVFFPSGWFGRGLIAIEQRDWGELGLWTAALWSTALMGLVACDWLAGPFYYRGWCAARTSGATARGQRSRLYARIDRALAWLPAHVRCIVTKDISVFWRDPAQWSQIMILFGVLFIYIANLRSVTQMIAFPIFPLFQSLISLFNIGATAFVLSILTTRFVYPMLSLEGKQQWIVGLAPMASSSLIWIKYVVCSLSSLVVTTPLVLLSCFMLSTDATLTRLALLTILTVSLSLNALAIGLGAWMPNFEEDNPSRIANGLGGTLNVIVSLVYIGLTLTLEAPWVHVHLNGSAAPGSLLRFFWLASIPLWVALQIGAVAGPLAAGLAHWRRTEF
jgi:ABC-2 type transport system permease protein